VLRALGAEIPAAGVAPARRLASDVLSALLDPTIVLSFSRAGYRIHALAFDAADLDVDLSGRVCLVTGANSGIGLETARALAARGADVRMLCRSLARGSEAAARLRAELSDARLTVHELDVSDLDAVRDFAAKLDAPRVDVLVHNAGVLPAQR
jgi:NADP-dependent 3-hydroxy acid dehydrogenase YdfG